MKLPALIMATGLTILQATLQQEKQIP